MIRFLTTADTEILATASAVERLPEDFPQVRCANPVLAEDAAALVEETLAGARVVLVRLLGGRRAWEDGFELLHRRCTADGVALIALGGEAEPDAELAGRSTAPGAVVAEAHAYLRHGGVENTEQLLRFLGDTLLLRGDGFEGPAELADHSGWDPERGDVPVADLVGDAGDGRPRVGIVFYRSHRTSGNTGFVGTLAEAVTEAGGVPVPVWCASLRPDAEGAMPVLDALQGHVDVLLTTVLASGGSTGGDAAAEAEHDGWSGWDVGRLERLGVPVLQAAVSTQPRERWLASDAGLGPLDVAMQVAIPEFDGRVLAGVVSFKEREGEDSPVGTAISRYVADPERCRRVAGLAVRHGVLRRKAAADAARLDGPVAATHGGPPADARTETGVPVAQREEPRVRDANSAARRRVAIVLSSSPTSHARIGNAVGLDTPRSALVLLDALREAGLEIEHDLEDGDDLIHRLIAQGGHDPELLSEDQLAANPHRLPAADYAAWFGGLDAELREKVEADWGPAPGDLYVHDDAIVVSGLDLGDVFIAIQPPRAVEEDAAAVYHDSERAATHHYLGVYRWLDAVWGADAIVHLGKHGTLEWLPGKSIGLSAACQPDAILGDLPLVYPFIVNDPGEGVQSKRRAHATIVDHLVPPMARADVYDELQELEHLLDEYVRVEALDPDKLPALAKRIWETIEKADLRSDLQLDDDDADEEHLDHLINKIDGYICEIKDLPIKDGLHVLGGVPQGQHLQDLVGQVLRLGQKGLPGLREAVGTAYGLDEPALVADAGARLGAEAAAAGAAGASPASASGSTPPPAADAPGVLALSARFPGPAATAGDLVDRLDDAQRALLHGVAEDGWRAGAVESLVTGALLAAGGDGHGDGGPDGTPDAISRADLHAVLELACTEVVPRIARSTEELDALIGALSGRYVPSGPSGSPTRGRLDVLPTGRNFYGVDPKGLPGELAWDVGRRLADDLLRRHEQEEGRLPEQIGIVVWGTANMRTHGDDVAEILALLGVRPTWHPETRRISGLEVIPLDELGRPRIDVTVRISGFFRDAFPNLIDLIDDATALVAGLDEPDEQNLVAKHARADRDRLLAEVAGIGDLRAGGEKAGPTGEAERAAAVETALAAMSAEEREAALAGATDEQRDAAWRRATTRVFGSKPGTYGAGLLELVDTKGWRDEGDLAAVYETWGGYAYGRGLDGVEQRASMREQFARIEVAVKNLDTREHDLFDSDGYFQYHGGMVAMVRSITGEEPKAWLGDSADPSTVATRTLAEEARRVMRSRVLNPRWTAGMIRHGYKGAMELSATVDYLFGYDATAGVVEDWMYERVTDRYVSDPDVRDFLEKSSPWALRAIASRLLEAADRGLWEAPDEERLQALRDAVLEMEGEVEEAGAR